MRRSPVLLIAREITVSVTTRRVSVSAIEDMLVTDVRFNHVLSEDVLGTEYVIPIHIVVSARKILEVLDVQLETRVRGVRARSARISLFSFTYPCHSVSFFSFTYPPLYSSLATIPLEFYGNT